MTTTIRIERRNAQAWIWLDRPTVHNAFNPALIRELTEALLDLQNNAEVRVLILGARGKSFCAGADLAWMQQAAALAPKDNLSDALNLVDLFRTLYRCPKPVIARVQGAAMGGGMGLVAACDIAVTTPGARFSLSEVRLGLIPAVIGPYVAEAIGLRQMRRYCLTAETLSSERALALGLVHEICPDEQLDARIAELAAALEQGGPQALTQAKTLLRHLYEGGPGDDVVLDDTARRIAKVRAGDEAREGLQAFMEKRTPNWNEDPS